ncbi:MAG TPA: HDOD domain-containing protein, partial [Vicinamibacterales bacterium]|nr:HDOD domain-containing protein [Vicinamibacterales bacterium]
AARALVHARRVNGRPQLIAEKIETVDLYDRARSEGYGYFQGFYFGKPVTRPGEPLPGHHLGYLRLLHALQDPNLSAEQLETLVKPDPRLCYMILRTVNSAGFAMRRTVHSIREGLVLLGSDAVRRWASLWVLADLGRQGHPELVAMSATRARCCELIAAKSGDAEAAGDGFIVGMCSLLDSILARPMDQILEHLPISDVAKGALLGEDNAQRLALEATIAYERGDWQGYLEKASRARLEPSLLPQVHSDALRWSSQLQRVAEPASAPVKTEAASRR